jgi:hypothetical protein
MKTNTPLWYYILLEAQLNEGGGSLGVLGSQIVAGTIAGALLSNPNSYLCRHGGAGWHPHPWRTPAGCLRISSLHDVVRVVGLA